jgi:hypothetical protein
LATDEVYDLRSAASFVADFFDYLPLENVTQLVRVHAAPLEVCTSRRSH